MLNPLSKFSQKIKQFCCWFLLSLLITILLPIQQIKATDFGSFKTVASSPTSDVRLKVDPQSLPLIEQGKLLYEAEKYAQAIKTLQPAIELYRSQQDLVRMAMVYNNLALSHQQLNEYIAAGDNLARSFELIQTAPQSMERQVILAQALDIQGKLDLERGKAEAAWTNWQQAAIIYDSLDNKAGIVRSRINQAQALQTLGFYRRAAKTLEQVKIDRSVDNQLIVRSLGNTYLSMGESKKAEGLLLFSLSLAKESNSQADISAAFFSLGNFARSQNDNNQAEFYYQQAVETAPNLVAEVQARLNLLRILISSEADYKQQLNQLKPLIAKLPLNRSGIYAKINYAQNLIKIGDENQTQLAELTLQKAIAQARQLTDKSAEAYSSKALGRLYETQEKWQAAEQITQQALFIAQEINARDIAYQGQWQLGRLYKVQQKPKAAIAAYQQAVEILQSLRNDLVAVNPEIQFTFRENVEPIYRGYVSLLLDSDEPGENNLIAARGAIDSLQLAELENFFRATCLNTQPIVIDKIADTQDLSTAIVYPIALKDRFEIIVKLPRQKLRHYSTTINNPKKVDRILTRLSETLTQRNSSETLPLSQLVYSWIIKPAAADLAKSQIKTLVFVLDSPLRNIPMATLHDGKQYLVEKYAVAITPGLQLIQPQAIANQQLQALTAGLTEARAGFPPLEYVAQELDTIQSQIATTKQLLNKSFTNDALQQQNRSSTFSHCPFSNPRTI